MSSNSIDVKSLIIPMDDEYAQYLKDESRSIGQAQSISFPNTEAEIAAIVCELSSQGTRITVQGGRTGISAGAVPNGGHVMNLGRMTDVLGLRIDSDGNFCVRVEPGLALSTLREMLENRKLECTFCDEVSRDAHQKFTKAPEQFFPTDPTETSATFGGIAACNSSGARSYLYGPVRPFVTALRIVLADGQTLALERGKVLAVGRKLTLHTEQGKQLEVPLPSYNLPQTKNASGYYTEDNMDAIDLFIGSDGTLGIITDVEIKLLPNPSVIWGISCFPSDEMQAVNLVEMLRQRIGQIAAIEYFDESALEILREQKAAGNFAQMPEIPSEHGTCVYCELHCDSESDAEERILLINDIYAELGIDESSTWMTSTAKERAQMAELRHAVPESVNLLIDQRKKIDPVIIKLGSDMSVPRTPGRLMEVVKMYRQSVAERNLQTAVWGHIGDNHVHVNVLPHNAEEYEKGKEMFQEWAKIISEQGGAVSAEHGAGKLKAGLIKIMYGEESLREMAQTKASLDPKGLLGVNNLFSEEFLQS